SRVRLGCQTMRPSSRIVAGVAWRTRMWPLPARRLVAFDAGGNGVRAEGHMGEHMSWVTRWEQWRRALGPSGSRQRANVEAFLDRHPAILYWGDSWFSSPLYLILARQSARRINGFGMIKGKPGALADSLLSTREVERMGDRIANNPF